MKRRFWWIFSVVILSISLLLLSYSYIFQDDAVYYDHFREKYCIASVELPEKLEFAYEDVPLWNFDTRESLEREMLINVYWQSQTLILLKRSTRFFPVIEPILERYGIPNDFKYLPVIESGLANVVSPSGAAGFWQFLEGTARELALEVNKEVDERYHLEKATEAACKYLLKSYRLYNNNWTMAVASYNGGRRGVNDQVIKQKTENFYDLLLTEETARYVFRILAVKIIFENPAKYGFHLRDSDYYKPVQAERVIIDAPVANFADYAKEKQINYKILKFLNPWLRDNFLTNKTGKSYYISLPVKIDRKFTYPGDTIIIDTLIDNL